MSALAVVSLCYLAIGAALAVVAVAIHVGIRRDRLDFEGALMVCGIVLLWPMVVALNVREWRANMRAREATEP